MGVGLFAGTAAWMLFTSLHSGADAAREVLLLLACGLVLVAVRAIGWPGRLLVPAAALVAAVIVAARSRTGVLSTTPLSGPLEYVNADGAFYVQATFAGLMLAVCAGPWLLRVLGGVGAGIFATLPFAVHVLAAAWLVVVLPGLALLCVAIFGARGVRASVLCSALLFIVAVGATVWLGSGHSPGAKLDIFQRAAIKAVDEHRLVLWNDAFNIMRRHPVAGVGAGRYQVVSPIAAQDKDSRWAHNEFLQQGAEAGIPGLLLLVLVFVWAFSRLLVVRSPDVITALSAAGLAALGIHASIDYVLHFPVIPIVAATLVAAGTIEAGPSPRWLAKARAMVEQA
jgi:O-antigen ligase